MTGMDTGTVILVLAAGLAGGYLLGSIPFGIVLTRLAGLGDIRKVGSGNIGATNVLRTGRKGLAAATLLFDGGKGALAVLIGLALQGPALGAMAGAGAFLGHLFPVWLRFRGGKGVATYLGVMLAIFWPIGILSCLTWLAVALKFRYSSLAALVSATLTPLYCWVAILATPGNYPTLAERPAVLLATFMAVLILLRHRDNIRRLIAGEEPRIGGK